VRRVEKWKIVRIIWNRQQWKPDRGWYPYTGSSPHTDHLHTEIGQSFDGTQLPRCAGGGAGFSGDSPALKAFLVYLGGPNYTNPFPRLRKEANALSAFNLGSFYCRRVAGSTRWSNHAYGTAIDIGVHSIQDGDRVKNWMFSSEEEEFMAGISEKEQKFMADFLVGMANGWWVAMGKKEADTPAIVTGRPPKDNERALGYQIGAKLAKLTTTPPPPPT
jgi:Extensin-like protein C-terminus